MKGLTAKQRSILDFIRQYIDSNHYSPSLDEIRLHFACSSLSTIHQHLSALKKKDYIAFQKGAKRSLILRNEKESSSSYFSIPLIGQFSSGLPLEIFSKGEETFEWHKPLTHPEKTYAFRIHGDGLFHELIFNQDILIIEACHDLKKGDTGLFSLKSGPSYIKRYVPEEDQVRLEHLNPLNFSPVEVLRKDEFIIRGKVIYLIRSFK
jgi:repressor LexA